MHDKEKVYAVPPTINVEDTSRQTYENNTGRFALNSINKKDREETVNHFFYPPAESGTKHLRAESSASYGQEGTSTTDVTHQLGYTDAASTN